MSHGLTGFPLGFYTEVANKISAVAPNFRSHAAQQISQSKCKKITPPLPPLENFGFQGIELSIFLHSKTELV